MKSLLLLSHLTIKTKYFLVYFFEVYLQKNCLHNIFGTVLNFKQY